MCGDLEGDRRGQLAAMDAVLFFLIAGAISSLMLVNVLGSQDPGDLGREETLSGRAAEMLRSFLDASLGRKVVLFVDESELVVSPASRIADCICAELAGLENGVDQVAFSDLNVALCSALDSMAGASVTAYICVHDMEDASTWPVLSLPAPPPDSPNVYGSSCVLGDGLAARYVAVLLLDPSPLPQGL